MLIDRQPVNAGRDLAVLARLLDAWTDVGVPQCDAVLVVARGIDNLPGRTAPWASIQLRRRRPYAVEVLAISSLSSCSFVGENLPIANQARARTSSPRFYQDVAQKADSTATSLPEGLGAAGVFPNRWKAL